MYHHADCITVRSVRVSAVYISLQQFRIMPFDIFRSNNDFDLKIWNIWLQSDWRNGTSWAIPLLAYRGKCRHTSCYRFILFFTLFYCWCKLGEPPNPFRTLVHFFFLNFTHRCSNPLILLKLQHYFRGNPNSKIPIRWATATLKRACRLRSSLYFN